MIGLPFAIFLSASDPNVVRQARTEFGVHRVFKLGGEHSVHALRHGGIIHGLQYREPGRTMEPLGYYHPESAVGEALAWRKRTSGDGDAAVVGLGAGAALSHRRPNQRFVFFEIDPEVARIAADSTFFSYLTEAKEGVQVRIGDGRRQLSMASDGSFETIFLDAFGGDAVPTHLLTRDAFAIYLRKLKKDGVIIVNITNWFVDLEGVVANVGASIGLAGVGKYQLTRKTDHRIGPTPTRCLVFARGESTLAGLDDKGGWRRLKPSPRTPLWSDDFTDVWAVIRWQ